MNWREGAARTVALTAIQTNCGLAYSRGIRPGKQATWKDIGFPLDAQATETGSILNLTGLIGQTLEGG